MPSFRTTRKVRHSAREMFDLVADTEAYPQFVPLCLDLKLRRKTEDAGVVTKVVQMTVGYKALRETFTSRVVCDPQILQILVSYVDGPFRRLENRWSFRDEGPGASIVEFEIAYEFRSPALGLLMGGVFDKAFRKFAEAFEQRADLVYGASLR
ncbi:cyclase/dehydrase [Methylocella silvestris BL2]|uniref:Cyclase/dehydrase n=1 Tax=Methylocella silvestris (strain DSM 15510 / CIP 108128 / LMG 27833 / NCIMB 13906 / BL2) TaxID=395965 RepID=B8EJU2_METSB|nr:type II toxin-antitoxin system RatA family toxin [Methylocella silvestris]ACK49496.1 cyclase/dehydrase [Methylocella silvestris BL2]